MTTGEKPPLERIRQYALDALSTYDPNKTGNVSIETEFGLVGILHEEYSYSKGKFSDEEWATTRRRGTERWLHAWHRLDNAIDPTWDPNDLPMLNVAPPEGVSGFAGMPPELIKDADLRAKYEEAIERNKEKIRMRNEQLKLRSIKRQYFQIVKKYLTETYSIPPHDEDAAVALIKSQVKDPKTRAEFLEAVAGKDNVQSQKGKMSQSRDNSGTP
jgi:hypothetical protein